MCLDCAWVIDEVRFPVNKGYKISEIQEYTSTKSRKLILKLVMGPFVEYINTFLKLKAEASGYPSLVRTLADEQYIKQFYESESIQLEKDSISYNASKRGLAKLCLNSMWGKLTERSNRTHTKLISEPHKLYKFLVTPGIKVLYMMLASDDVVWI
jgi:hypothetical protein